MGRDVFIVEPFSTAPAAPRPIALVDRRQRHPDDVRPLLPSALDAGDADGKPLPTYWDVACSTFLGVIGCSRLPRCTARLLSYPAVIDCICDFPSIKARPRVPRRSIAFEEREFRASAETSVAYFRDDHFKSREKSMIALL
jgi:hypothetical protein